MEEDNKRAGIMNDIFSVDIRGRYSQGKRYRSNRECQDSPELKEVEE